MYDIIIIGAGTAGMSAAIYGKRAGKSVLMIESGMYGGQIINASEVENYPGIAKISGYQFAMNLYEQASGLGAELACEKVVDIVDYGAYKRVVVESEVAESKVAESEVAESEVAESEVAESEVAESEVAEVVGKYLAKTVIIATGAKKRRLGLEAEQRLIGRGVSYCATCDGAFFRDKTVAVYGGGNTALGDAEYLSAMCKKVYLIHRRNELRGNDITVNQLREKENVEFLLDTIITDVQGSEKLESIRITSSKDSVHNDLLEVDGLFVAIGQEPANAEFATLVELDSAGYILAGEDCKTNVPGIYAAGDCRVKQVRQLTTAAADGSIAAMSAVEYISYH